MQKILFLTIFSTMIVFYACKKDESINSTTIDKKNSKIYDTIKPLSYFPAYPGSYWIYNTNDTLKVAKQYKKHTFQSNYYCSYCVPQYKTYYVPKLQLNNIYTDYDKHIFVRGYFLSYSTILSETEGEENPVYYSWPLHHTTVCKTIIKDTSITVNGKYYDNVLLTIEYYNGCDYGIDYGQGVWTEDSCATKRDYYAKDIGLIKREEGGINNHHIWTTTLELTDYKINK